MEKIHSQISINTYAKQARRYLITRVNLEPQATLTISTAQHNKPS
jgi:hypothetical protein